jgi:hypothetical protein
VEDHAAGVEHLGVHEFQGKVSREAAEHPRPGGDDRRVHGDQVLILSLASWPASRRG